MTSALVTIMYFLQWFPYTPLFQCLYLLWRWGLFLYFFAWLISVGAKSDVSTFFTFLTIWSFIAYNLYLLVSAVSVSTEFVRIYILKSPSRSDSSSHEFKVTSQPPRGCCGYADNNLSWYLSVHWFFFLMGNMFAVTIPLLYWPALYRGGSLSAEDLHVHLINGIFAFSDVLLSGIPVYLFHLVYLAAFGCVYTLFSGLYFAGTKKVIYPVLDYECSVGKAIGLIFIIILVVIPIIYLVIFYIVYKVKMIILYKIWGKRTDSYRILAAGTEQRDNYDTFTNESTVPV